MKTKTLTLSDLVDMPGSGDFALWLKSTHGMGQRSSELLDLENDQVLLLEERLGQKNLVRLLERVNATACADTLALLDEDTAREVLKHLSHYQIADAFRTLSAPRQARLMLALEPVAAATVGRLQQWDGELAGGNMTPSFLTLPESTTAGEALVLLQSLAKNAEAANYIYLTDHEGVLSGAVSLRGVVTAHAQTTLSSFKTEVIQTVEPTVDREVAAKILNDYDLVALPVVQDGRPLGVITADRAAEIMDAETTEDFRRMGTAGGLTKSLKDASVWMLYRSRVVWLVVLVFGNIFSGAGIAHYESLIESVVALVFFLPLLIDSGGNAGAQSATLMVRGLATGDVEMRDWFKILGKEILVASLLGLSMALAVSSLGFIRGGPEIALVVSLTMVLIVIMGSVIGMSLPFLLSKLKLDPASASAPLITSICDGLGVLIYFYIASQILL